MIYLPPAVGAIFGISQRLSWQTGKLKIWLPSPHFTFLRYSATTDFRILVLRGCFNKNFAVYQIDFVLAHTPLDKTGWGNLIFRSIQKLDVEQVAQMAILRAILFRSRRARRIKVRSEGWSGDEGIRIYVVEGPNGAGKLKDRGYARITARSGSCFMPPPGNSRSNYKHPQMRANPTH
ncbi:hypothetical protein C8F04DRAFT_1332376 [Mycena alexandri]|uniref:Uncharacterized protein n=1 Tax=Mycena alexandri TaxID=1745969 RepID=A0AAD6RYK0_9AGAR|nr:hypothetical protein C8F04DRAFT_1332376 [Mycena alexandri]